VTDRRSAASGVNSGLACSAATPRAALSTFDGAMIVCGIVIGGGIFALPPLVAATAGSLFWMYGVWIIGAVLTLAGTLCYAELATTFPHAGGDYHFLTRAFGRDLSFFFGWARVAVITTGATAVHAFIFGDYASRILPLNRLLDAAGSPGHELASGNLSSAIYAALIVLVLTILNIVGLKESSRTQNVVTTLLIVGMGLVAFGGYQSPAVHTAGAAAGPAGPLRPPLAQLGQALVFVLFAFGGWNEAAYISSELRGGRRTVLVALLAAIAVITVVYLVFVAALASGLGFEGLKASHAPAADVAQRGFGEFGQTLIASVVCLSVLASCNATMIVGARSNYALGQDWPIVSFMSQWNRERDTPVAAFVVQGAITLGLVAFAAFQPSGVRAMVEFTAPVFWFFFMLAGVALMVLRRKFAHVPRPFAVPFYPAVPLLFIATCVFLLWSSLAYAQSQHAIQVSFLVMAAGLAAWIIARFKRR
jgi:basic amino acid/polyamine antiporter, APA family